MALRVVIENAVLRGSPHEEFWQRVATVYSPSDEEFRGYAPPRATGSALGWFQYLSVRQLSESGMGENFVENGRRYSIANQVKEELEKLELDEDIWRDLNSQGRYYAAQVCVRGHPQSVDGRDFRQGAHCKQCGESCIDRCQNCKAPIHGKDTLAGGRDYILPNFCHKCGRPYSWMEDRRQTAKELLNHDNKLSLEEREELWGLLQYVMSDPKSDLAPAKRKLFEIRIAKALPATREFFLDFMAKLCAEMLKG
jgi:hypothetical protein